MEFLKKHCEKIALVSVSVLLIATASILWFIPGQKSSGRLGNNGTNLSPAKPLDTDELKNIARLLKEPLAWTGTDHRPFASEPWVSDGVDFRKKSANIVVTITNHLLELDWTTNFRTFPMVFMSVASRVSTNNIFQINIAGAGTRFVRSGDSFKQRVFGDEEQFTVLGYVEKKEKRTNPSTGGVEWVDLSVLTLQRKSGRETKSIPLLIGRTQLEREPLASYYSTTTGEKSGELNRGVRFAYKGEQFELLDITTQEVVIKGTKDGRIERRPSRVTLR